MNTSLREKLAELEHDRWLHWQRYCHDKGHRNDDGSLTIPEVSVRHWERQIATPYSKLSEKEKDSDRKEADKTLSVLRSHQSALTDEQFENLWSED